MDESVVKEFEQQQVGKLKLSQAIRIGAALRPYAKGDVREMWRQGRSCALLAAYEVLYGWPKDESGATNIYCFPGVDHPTISNIYFISDNRGREAAAVWLEAQGL